MNRTVKKSISIIAAVILIGCMYYGSYLPWRKSTAYIDALHSLSSTRSLGEFEKNFSASLDIPSPIGQPELVRNLGNVMIGLFQGTGKTHPEIIPPALEYLNHYYEPLLARGRGMSFTQDVYIMGTLYNIVYQQLHDPAYLKKSEEFYKRGLELSPTRPQFLYGLLGVYQDENNPEEARKIAEQIVAQWPADASTKALLEHIPVGKASSSR